MIRRVGVALVLGLMWLAKPATVEGQCRWSLMSSLGYGGAGVGLSFLASNPGWPPLSTLVAVTGASTTAGYMMGARAGRDTPDGPGIGGVHRTAVRLGTVFAGGTGGALVAAVITQGEGESGSVERVLATSIGVGVASGILLQYLLERGRPLTQTMSVGIDENGGAAIAVTIAFD